MAGRRANPEEVTETPTGDATADTSRKSAKSENRSTMYFVFTAGDIGGPWEKLVEVEAKNQDEARKAAVAGREQETGFMAQYFVAVSASSFKPKQPTVATNVTVTF